MPAPAVLAMRVPFYYAAPPPSEDAIEDGPAVAVEAPVFITNVMSEVVAFGARFFWLHVSESPTGQHVPRLGSCSVSVGRSMGGTGGQTSISSSSLLEFEAARLQDMSAGTNTSVQSVFATSLSAKLVRGVAKRLRTPVTVYVNCAVEGDRTLALLGTDGGTAYEKTFQFGALVYREAFAMVSKLLEAEGAAA